MRNPDKIPWSLEMLAKGLSDEDLGAHLFGILSRPERAQGFYPETI